MHKLRTVQTQLIVSPVTRQRADALALVCNVSRAEIWRKAIEGRGLTALEQTHLTGLCELNDLAAKFGFPGGLVLAEQMVKEGVTLTEAREMSEYPRAADAPAVTA
jgi:hypothetical protein